MIRRQQRLGNLFLITLLTFLVLAATSDAYEVINDDFDDGVLDPFWQIQFANNTDRWTFKEAGSHLTVTDISPVVVNTGSGDWSVIRLSETFSPVEDFVLGYSFSWDSDNDVQAMQEFLVRMLDSDDNIITYASYTDAWVGSRGVKVAAVDNEFISTSVNTMPFAGNASVVIEREDGTISIYWDGELFFSGTSTLSATKLEVDISFFPYTSPSQTSFFGTISLDNIHLWASDPGLSADIDSSGCVNLFDFSMLAQQYGATLCNHPDWCGGTDLNQDGQVDHLDVSYLVLSWLSGTCQ